MYHRIYYFLFFLLFISLISCKVSNSNISKPGRVNWIHGAADCHNDKDPLIQVVQLNSSTWMLRQNKCVNYEAPFMYLFMGNKKALLMDTGATEDEKQFPLFATVSKLIEQREKQINEHIELVVGHTHSHKDHVAADIQFIDKPGTTVVGLKIEDVKSFFKFENWPLVNSKLELGGRVIEFIPIPGHEIASVAVYDKQTKYY